MEEKDKKAIHTYEDIYPEGLTGVSGGSSGGISTGDIDATTLLYELGYSFLSKKIPDHYYYDTKPLKTFCNQLVNLFSVEGGPRLVQYQNNDEGYVSFIYGKDIDDDEDTEGQQELAAPKVIELTEEHKKEISTILKDTILQGSSFAHAWDYYVLGYGVENITKAHKVLDVFRSKDVINNTQGRYAVALSQNTSLTYAASDVISDDVAHLFEAKRIAVEKQSLRDSFGSTTFDQYIARLLLFKHDIREQYDIELKHRHKKPRKLAILATLIAYTTEDLHEFTTMMMRKAGHLEHISQGIYKNYAGTVKKPKKNTEGESMVVQKDLMMLPSQISDDLISTFNYRFIEAYHATFSLYSPIPKPKKTGCTVIDEYKHYMYKALKAKRDASLEFEHIDGIDDFEEDQADNFHNYASDHFDELAKRVAMDLHAIHNDYLLALEPDMLIHQEVFSYTPEQLKEYIDTTPASFIRYCAILLYIFSAKTLLECSAGLERYIDDILHQKQNIFVAESGLNRYYVGEYFDNIFNYIEADILVAVVESRRKYIEELISNTEEFHDTLAESHESEHNMYLQAMSLLVEGDDTGTEKQFLLSTYNDLVEIYRRDSQQDNNNDDEELV